MKTGVHFEAGIKKKDKAFEEAGNVSITKQSNSKSTIKHSYRILQKQRIYDKNL